MTGSAHCTLIPYWAARLGKTELTARQLSRRGGELYCKLRGDRVDIAGRAVEYLRGEIRVMRRDERHARLNRSMSRHINAAAAAASSRTLATRRGRLITVSGLRWRGRRSVREPASAKLTGRAIARSISGVHAQPQFNRMQLR